jgi:hypothetical protein
MAGLPISSYLKLINIPEIGWLFSLSSNC